MAVKGKKPHVLRRINYFFDAVSDFSVRLWSFGGPDCGDWEEKMLGNFCLSGFGSGPQRPCLSGDLRV